MCLPLTKQIPASVELDHELFEFGVTLVVWALAFGLVHQLPLVGEKALDLVSYG